MKRLLLCLMVAMVVLAGEPAVGATLELAPGPPLIGSNLLTAPIRWIVSFVQSKPEAPAPPPEN
jgi:hypothetical protein